MSHYSDLDMIAPCDNKDGICNITEAEINAVSDTFLYATMPDAFDAFEDVGDIPFIKKKIVQLIKIAKSEEEIQLDLVSELLLYLIGEHCPRNVWDIHTKAFASTSHFDYPGKEEFVKKLIGDANSSCDEIKEAFMSFPDLMAADREKICLQKCHILNR